MKNLLWIWLLITTATPAFGESSAAEQLFRFHYESAKRDNPESMYILGNMYEGGRGTAIDYDEAIKWYSRAAQFGNTRATDKIQEITAKKRLAAERSASSPRKDEGLKIQQQIQKAQALRQQLDTEKYRVEQAKAEAERAALLLQQQIESVKAETEKAQEEAEKVRLQQEQLQREKSALESLRHNLAEQERLIKERNEVEATVAPPEPAPETKEFKADPCEGPSARFMSTCR